MQGSTMNATPMDNIDFHAFARSGTYVALL